MTAPVPPEVVVETVARALWAEAQATAFMTVDPTERSREERYRRLAAAAIAALPPSPAEEAVQRVEAVAAELQGEADSRSDDSLISVAERSGLLIAVTRLRAVLASPSNDHRDDTDQGPTAADSGAPTSDRRQGAARTVDPVVVHDSERSVPVHQQRDEWLTKLAGAAGCRWWKDDPVCDEHGEEWPCKGDALLIVAEDFAAALASPAPAPQGEEGKR